LTVSIVNFIYVRFVVLVWLLAGALPALAQQVENSLPVPMGQFMRSYPLINPASAGAYSSMEVNTGVQRHGSSWSNISSYYLNANIRLGRTVREEVRQVLSEEEEWEEEPIYEDSLLEDEAKEKRPPVERFHVAGITLTGDKEGSFLRKTGIYGVYAWHTRLTRNVCVSAGASVGFKNYSVSSSYVYGGGSAYAPDASVGLWVYDNHYHFGISASQIFGGRLQPFREITRLQPHLNLTAARRWDINRHFSVKPTVMVLLAESNRPAVNLMLGAMLQELVSATIGYTVGRGLICIVGLERLNVGTNSFKAGFSYRIPAGSYSYVNIHTYEITLNYFMKAGRNRTSTLFQ
jgi:hypothetical protein